MTASRIKHLTKPILFFLVAASALLCGCGGSGGGMVNVGNGNGTLVLHMADAPTQATVSAVYVTIPKVDAMVGNQWVTVASPNKTYNLLDLALTETTLGQAELPPGSYSQLRLFVSGASVVDGRGTHTVAVPDAVKSGMAINVNFTIQSGAPTTLLLDFNVHQSLNNDGNGNYSLAPSVPAIEERLAGTLSGYSTDGVKGLPFTEVIASYWAGNSYPIGTNVDVTFSTSDGHFRLWELLPGTYHIELIYFDPVTLVYKDETFVGIVVSASHDTNVGVCKLPS